MMTKPFPVRFFYKGVILGLLMALAIPQIHAGAVKNLTLEEMTQASDVIAVGAVTKKEARWVGRRIETTLQIQAREYWKGDLGASFEIAQMGGEVTEPLPIAMQSDGAPQFFEGEKVVLFLEKPRKASSGKPDLKQDPKSKVPGSYKVVGWAQGKYTILPDPQTGEEKVVRLGLENMQILDKREMNRRIAVAESYAKSRLKKEGKDKAAPAQDLPPYASQSAKQALAAQSPKTPPKDVNNNPASPGKDSFKELDLPNREKLGDFKSKVQKCFK